MNISAAFTATWDAVATGLLVRTNIISGYMQMGDRHVPIGPMAFPVNPPELGGNPIPNNGQYWLDVNGMFGIPYPGNDIVEITGGIRPGPFSSTIYRDVYPDYHNSWPSDGWWSVTIVPEPSSLSLLLLAIAGGGRAA